MSCRNSCAFVFLTLVLCTAPACVADIVPISISEDANASGQAEACIGFCNFDPVFDSFNFSGPQSGQALAVWSNFGTETTSEVDVHVTRSVNVSAENLSALLELGSFGFACSNGNDCQASDNADNYIRVVFAVDSPALVHLTASCTVLTSNFMRDFGLELTGPGVSFGSPELAGQCPSFDDTLLFVPGAYQLVVDESFADSVNAGGFFSSLESIELNADFTSVPEPRWISLFFAPLMILFALYLRSRSHASTRYRFRR